MKGSTITLLFLVALICGVAILILGQFTPTTFDLYNNGKIICIERKDWGTKPTKKDCYRLTPIEDVAREVNIKNYINGEMDLRR